MADFVIDDTVDITDVVCPVTFVKAKVALEELDDGQVLSLRERRRTSTERTEKHQRRRSQDSEADRQRRRYL